MQHFPLRSSGRRILNYLDDRLILARSLDTLISHIDSLFIHLESLSYENPPLARSRGGWDPASREIAWDESLPLVRSRGNESSLSRDRAAANCLPCAFQAGQLCSVEGITETARTQGGGFSGITSVITHAPAAAMAGISSPVNGVDFGRLAHRGHIEALTQPRCARWSLWMHRLTAGD